MIALQSLAMQGPLHDNDIVAALLYRLAVPDDAAPPATFDALLPLVLDSGAHVLQCRDCPPDFRGIQIGNVISVNRSGNLTDAQERRILAHEWCHYLRQTWRESREVHLYDGKDRADMLEHEERIARTFERLF